MTTPKAVLTPQQTNIGIAKGEKKGELIALKLKWTIKRRNPFKYAANIDRQKWKDLKYFLRWIRHFRVEKGTGAEMRPAVGSGIFTR